MFSEKYIQYIMNLAYTSLYESLQEIIQCFDMCSFEYPVLRVCYVIWGYKQYPSSIAYSENLMGYIIYMYMYVCMYVYLLYTYNISFIYKMSDKEYISVGERV